MGIEVGGRHRIPSVIPHLMRESRKYFFSKQIKGKKHWIPAFAGMTRKEAGMTRKWAGMTKNTKK